MPIKPQGTRWSFQYVSVTHLLSLKSFCKEFEDDFPNLEVTNTTWQKLENLKEVLDPLFKLTKSLQRLQLKIPDFVKSWFSAMARLAAMERSGNAMAKHLLSSAKSRENQILLSPLVLASMYLDKRFASKIPICSDRDKDDDAYLKDAEIFIKSLHNNSFLSAQMREKRKNHQPEDDDVIEVPIMKMRVKMLMAMRMTTKILISIILTATMSFCAQK